MADDPWDWDTARVVKELCTPDRSWIPRHASPMSARDLEVLEENLRENAIDGYGMLNTLDIQTMREFGLKTAKQRQWLSYAITELQNRSDVYSKRPPVEALPEDRKRSAPEHFDESQAKKQKTTPEDHEPPALNTGEATLNASDSDETMSFSPEELAVRNVQLDPPESHSSRLVSPEHVSLNDAPQEKSIKEPKRLAPTFVSPIGPGRQLEYRRDVDDAIKAKRAFKEDMSDAADNQAIVEEIGAIQPGTAFTDQAGKKRMVPILQIPASNDSTGQMIADVGGEELEAIKSPVVDRKSRGRDPRPKSLAQGYLGKKKMHVDDIFYGKGFLNAESDESNESEVSDFQIPKQEISSGRRLYVNSTMKRFLSQNNAIRLPERFSRNGKSYSAILPYPVRLVEEYHERSFTLLHKTETGEVLASQQAVSQWPELKVEGTRRRTQFEIGGDSNKSRFLDPDELLERYSNIPNGDFLLPVFGESGSEGEYDYPTWKEMEAENRELEGVEIRSKRRPISVQAVNSAIDEALAELKRKWQDTKLPKLAAKAWAIYRKYRRLEKKSRKHHRHQLQQEILHIDDERIPKLRKEIAGEAWTRQKQVYRQAMGSMEVSVFERERKSWELTILKSKIAPEKPAEIPRPVKKETSAMDPADGEEVTPLAEGEEQILSDSDVSSNEDDLADFIVADGGMENVEVDDGDDKSSDLSETEGSRSLNDIPLPEADESSEDEAELLPPIPRNVASPTGRPSSNAHSHRQFVDLTLTSNSAAEERASRSNTGPSSSVRSSESPKPTVIDLVTPKKESGRKFIVKSKGTSEPIVISSDSDSLISKRRIPTIDELPPYHDTAAIAKLSYEVLAELEDRDRLLIAWLHNLQPRDLRARFLAQFQSNEEDQMWLSFQDVLQAMYYDQGVDGMESSVFGVYMSIIRALKMYVDCKHRGPFQKKDDKYLGVSIKLLNEMETSRSLFHDLYELVLNFAKGLASDEEDDEDGEPLLHRPARISPYRKRKDSDSELDPELDPEDPELDSDLEPTSSRKRKLVENQEARELREYNKERLLQQSRRRLELQEKLASQGISTSSDSARIIINDGKQDDEGYIYIHETIGRRIKPHQINGVRFMWEQIVTDSKNMQGCLLAHIMGLGKTMQVITLLVAIAEASKSEDQSVSKQIPSSLRLSRYLVLCPPGLVDNWEDELLTWAPQHALGGPFKVTSHIDITSRIEMIEEWYEDGGVLIMGYDMFRNLLTNKATKNKRAALSEEGLQDLRNQLLDGPTIIIADEAHKLKNPKAQISVFASQFASKSRIALTGSPLNNNIEEYHSMIDWVAPNYLGPISEFRAKYKIPIEAGLWVDSDRTEKRKSKKMLALLTSELELKMNRANMAVLKNDLPPKKEFVLRIALTQLQKDAYILYVRHMRDGRALDNIPLTKDGHIMQSTLWSWLSVLSLLCNHPACFKEKINELTERKSAAHTDDDGGDVPTPGRTSDEDGDASNGENQVATVLGATILQADADNSILGLLESVDDIMAPALSAKIKIFSKILDECREIGDKVLVFTQSIPTLNFLEQLCKASNRKYQRLDGKTQMSKRHAITKEFNTGSTDIFLISTQAGGLGLNLYSANRVIIFDFKYNPTQEEQAIGRAYRIGQTKPVFVYRFVMSGTFEELIENKAVYKMQLASRVIDKENPMAWAKKRAAEYLVDPRETPQQDLSQFHGEDPAVLDKVLHDPLTATAIRSILKTDTFAEADDEVFTAEDQKEVEELKEENRLKRVDPEAYKKMVKKRQDESAARIAESAARIAEAAARNAAFRNQRFTHNYGIMSAVDADIKAQAKRLALRASSTSSNTTALSPQVQQAAQGMTGGNQNVAHTPIGLDQPLRVQGQREGDIDPIRGGFTQEQVNTLSEPQAPAPDTDNPEAAEPVVQKTATIPEITKEREQTSIPQGTPLAKGVASSKEAFKPSLFAALPPPSKALDAPRKKKKKPYLPDEDPQPEPSTPRKTFTPNHKVSSKGSIFGVTNVSTGAAQGEGSKTGTNAAEMSTTGAIEGGQDVAEKSISNMDGAGDERSPNRGFFGRVFSKLTGAND